MSWPVTHMARSEQGADLSLTSPELYYGQGADLYPGSHSASTSMERPAALRALVALLLLSPELD